MDVRVVAVDVMIVFMSAFVVWPLLIASLFVGIPIAYLEVSPSCALHALYFVQISLGQFCAFDVVTLFDRLAPISKGEPRRVRLTRHGR